MANKDSFKQTEIGVIPGDWEVVRLGDIFHMQQGKAMSPKSRLGISPRPFLRTVNVLWGRLNLTTLDYMDFTDEEITKLCLQPGDLLVCEGGEIGRTAMWHGEIEVCGYQNHIHRLRKRRQDISPAFYMYWMQAAFLILSLYAGEEIRTTIPNLSRGRLKSFLIPKPPFEEQQKIAKVLGTIQSAIEQQDKIIEATKRFKKSLMQKLFTEGLNGEEQKETEIGLIPKNWEVVRLGEVCLPRKEIIQPAGEGRSRYIGLEHIDSGETKLEHCGLDTEVRSSKSRFYEGDILYGKLRPYLDKAILAEFDGICSTDIIVITTDSNKAIADCIVNLLHLPSFVSYTTSTMTGVNHPRTSWRAISVFKIPLPSLPEQQEIAHILSTVDKKIEVEEKRKATLKELFRTTLHKLMAGEIRLKDMEI
jgi:type I restriction enzyme S subunit